MLHHQEHPNKYWQHLTPSNRNNFNIVNIIIIIKCINIHTIVRSGSHLLEGRRIRWNDKNVIDPYCNADSNEIFDIAVLDDERVFPAHKLQNIANKNPSRIDANARIIIEMSLTWSISSSGFNSFIKNNNLPLVYSGCVNCED
jgi:hypothetical protein